MVDTPGRCRELDYCSIGQMRTLVRIPLGQPFVCPECGKPLRAPVSLNARLSRGRLAAWSVGTLGLFVLLYECVAPSSQHHHLKLAELTKPVVQPASPSSAQAPPAGAKAVGTQAVAPVSAAPVPPVALPARIVPAVPVPAPAPSQAASPAPSPTPAAAAKPPLAPAFSLPVRQAIAPVPGHGAGGKVRMECTVDASGVPTNCTVLKDQPVTSTPPAADLQRHIGKSASEPAAARAAAPVSIPALQAHAVEKPPANRDVSILPVAGGAPPYPSDYVRDGRRGEVAVDCIIDAGGEPTHCKVIDVLGGRRFAEAAVNWLNTGAVRFTPALRDGVPVAQERHWHIAFAPR